MQDIQAVLEEFGLTKTEAVIYLTLLKQGSSTAYRISKEAHLYKANTYQAIESLIHKALVVKAVINSKQKLTVVPPEEFISLLEKKKERMQSVLPLMERNFNEESEEISVFQGINAFMNLMYEFLKQNESIYVFDIPGYVPKIVQSHINDFHKERIKKKVKMYHIYDYDAKERITFLRTLKYTYAKQGTYHRNSTVSTMVCGNTTLIINWQKHVKTVRIVDKDISEAYRNQFSLLWEQK
ncbi:MAG: helix-turn-helix domain-containing protein [Candidatus Woesearchaeota archaeon]